MIVQKFGKTYSREVSPMDGRSIEIWDDYNLVSLYNPRGSLQTKLINDPMITIEYAYKINEYEVDL